MKLKYILITMVAAFFATNSWAIDFDPKAWMAQLPDTMKVRNVSIPGAHNAATVNATTLGGAKTQDLSISDQWDNGVRVFDLRPRKDMAIYHGVASTGVNMSSVFSTITGKLVDSKEFSIFVIRYEEEGEGTLGIGGKVERDVFERNLKALIETNKNYIVEFSPSLRVKDVRGKIIILVRGEFDSDKAAFYRNPNDNEQSLNNQKNAILGMGELRVKMYCQDHYEYSSDQNKQDAIRNMIDETTRNTHYPMWVQNNTSGYRGSSSSDNAVQTNANTMNKYFADYLKEYKPVGKLGMVMMDYAGSTKNNGLTLVNAVIAQNFVGYELGDMEVAWSNKDIVLQDVLKLSQNVDPSKLKVKFEPASEEGWLTENVQPEGMEDSTWKTWQDLLGDGQYVDGYWDPEKVQATIEGSNGTYTIHAMLPCSGLYKVTLTSDEVVLVPEAEEYLVTVYPSIMNTWTHENYKDGDEYIQIGTNIDGIPLNSDDMSLTYFFDEAGIVFNHGNHAASRIYTDGVYLADTWVFVKETAASGSTARIKRNADDQDGDEAEGVENHDNTSIVNLSELATEDGKDANKTYEVSIVLKKNGVQTPVEASGMSKEFITVSASLDVEIPTEVEAIDAEAYGEIEVYSVNGVRIGNNVNKLQPGIYIFRQGDKTYKVLVK